MVPLLSLSSLHYFTTSIFFFKPSISTNSRHFPKLKHSLTQSRCFSVNSVQNDASEPNVSDYPAKSQLRTLFPGGYKRPEIKLPNIVLQLNADEVLRDGSVLDVIDGAVAKWVGIVVVNGGEVSGGKLYEAACLLKSVIRDRAYLLVVERVDIAAAVNASGVVLSDQGLPSIVARSTMMGSKFESVVLPMVGRSVQTVNAAVTASNFEGADFLICSISMEERSDFLMQSMNENVKIPFFVETTLMSNDMSFDEISKLLMSGASGIVITLERLKSSGVVLSKLLSDASTTGKRSQDEFPILNKLNVLNATNGFSGEMGINSSVKVEDKKSQFIKKERHLLLEAVNAIEKAAPLMEEISLLNDSISQLDEPFLLVIVGEFNTGKSTVINALLGGRFLKEGVVPTTNEITFLRYSEVDSQERQRCERHPDGQYICYLPAQILKKMVIVDTPGTNVILQRQQRLTEEFVPRADLLLFILSADRPLSESEVAFLRYTQQWKKKVMFLLNKADLYGSSSELAEAITFVKENVQKLLNVEHVKLFPVSARSALKAKLATIDTGTDQQDMSESEAYASSHSFTKFEKFLYGFLDGSTSAGLESMKIKLETPVGIAERLLSSCQTLMTQDCQYAKKDLMLTEELIRSVEEYASRMESESISWRRQIFSLVESLKARLLKLVESTLQLSNLDLAFSLILKGDNSASIPAAQSIQNDIVGPTLSDAHRILVEYTAWLRGKNASEARRYKETFEKRLPSSLDSINQVEFKTNYLPREVDSQSIKSLEKCSGNAASKLFYQEVRQVFFGAFGGLGAAGLSASLLTSVLPSTLEDLLALGLCSAGGFLAISNFPVRRQKVGEKVKNIADAVGQEIEEAMQKDLLTAIENIEEYVALIGKPYKEAAQQRLDKLLDTQQQLTDIKKKLRSLQVELQNFHLS